MANNVKEFVEAQNNRSNYWIDFDIRSMQKTTATTALLIRILHVLVHDLYRYAGPAPSIMYV